MILYRRTDLPPASMNLFKNVLAVGMITATLAVSGTEIPRDRPLGDWLALVGSGLLGLAVADTLLFAGLRRIGAARLAVVDTVYAPMMVLLSWGFLGERPTAAFALGGAAVVLGVAVASVDLRRAVIGGDRGLGLGVLMALGAITGTGVSVIWVKPILEGSDLIEVTWVRMVAGIAGQALWTTARGGWGEVATAFRPGPAWRTLVPGAVIGTYFALVLWLGGFKWADASVAAVLNQLATVYVLGLAWAVLGESLGRRQLVGGLLALIGAMIVVVG